jgi:hypothetical protein
VPIKTDWGLGWPVGRAPHEPDSGCGGVQLCDQLAQLEIAPPVGQLRDLTGELVKPPQLALIGDHRCGHRDLKSGGDVGGDPPNPILLTFRAPTTGPDVHPTRGSGFPQGLPPRESLSSALVLGRCLS